MEWLLAQFTSLYGVLLALSLFNVIVLLWLGLTVLLNAGRRTWGVWLAGAGLLAGAVFFVSHSAFAVHTASGTPPGLATWWPVGWMALIFAPFAWYLAILWHTGYWDSPTSRFRREHRPLLALTTLLAAGLFVVFVTSRPLHSNIQLAGRYFITAPLVFGMPLPVIVYPVFVFFCIGFALEALRRPGPALRAVQRPARMRARPWLISATLSLMTVSALMLFMLLYLVLFAGTSTMSMILDQSLIEAYWLDFIISLAITAAVVLTGQAIIAYEIFTGRTLPRRGLRRQWHETILLAAGFSAASGASFALRFEPIYATLVATVFVALVFAFFSWRTHVERQSHMSELRPFVTSERVFDGLLSPRPAGDPGGPPVGTPAAASSSPLAALCQDVLAAKSACLVPAGYLSSLVPAPLSFPAAAAWAADMQGLLEKCSSPDVVSVPVDPATHGGSIWAIPLWSARGLIGVLLLGEREDGGLYSEEAIEVARASGERLLDMIASVALARRLMALQRQRLAEIRVMDSQSRRVLHDEILPDIHAAMLALSGAQPGPDAIRDVVTQLAQIHKHLSMLIREMPSAATARVEQVGLVGLLRQTVSSEFSSDFASVDWEIESEAEEQGRSLPGTVGDVVFHAAREVIRNSARHGRGDDAGRELHLRIGLAWRDGIEITVSDDGVGLSSRTETGVGAGRGLALHSTMLAVIGGSLVTENRLGVGAAATIFLPRESLGGPAG